MEGGEREREGGRKRERGFLKYLSLKNCLTFPNTVILFFNLR